MNQKVRMEQGGLFIKSLEHWEMWETKIYVYRLGGRVLVPKDIIRHLNLKHKDKIRVAIQKIEED